MKRIINLCSQGDVENPCPMRTVIPIYDENRSPEHIKVCCSKLPQTCSKVPTEIGIQTRHVFCNPVQSAVEYQFSATIDHG